MHGPMNVKFTIISQCYFS